MVGQVPHHNFHFLKCNSGTFMWYVKAETCLTEKLLDFKWVTPEQLKEIDLRPSNIRDILINGEYFKGLKHIVTR